MKFGAVARFAILLAVAIPAWSEIVIHTKSGKVIRVQVDASEIASIEFSPTAAPPPPPPPPSGGSVFQSLANGKTVSGEARGDKGGYWPFQLKITSYDPSTGAIVGQITWSSLSSVHRVKGTLAGTKLSFTETEAIRAGSAHLNVAYTFTLATATASGSWVDNGDKSHGSAKILAP